VPLAQSHPRHRLHLEVDQGLALETGEALDLGDGELGMFPDDRVDGFVSALDGRLIDAEPGRIPVVELA
jgi:hypothetical protein